MRKKRVGLALGGGSVRGLSHIGVLKVLKRNNIPVDFIAGTSIGAVIGGAYCAGIEPEELELICMTKDWRNLIDFSIPKKGFIRGQKIRNYIRFLVKDKNFGGLRVPLSVVATDLNMQEKVVFERGSLTKAIRASISLPGIFHPVKMRAMELVDGGLVDPVPFEEVIGRGADIVIAVDLSVPLHQVNIGKNHKGSRLSDSLSMSFVDKELSLFKDMFREKRFRQIPGFLQKRIYKFMNKYVNPAAVMEYLMRKDVPNFIRIIVQEIDILTNQLTKEKLKDKRIDVIINPQFHGVKWVEFGKAKYLIKKGEDAAEKEIPRIKRLLKSE
ncbi:patatin-like phospholipase family protein [Candidatus Woesearchaeota archaeon]|nr:patatin-like phospholipase family protein [Candidatus Woesearchaeota archaeon]